MSRSGSFCAQLKSRTWVKWIAPFFYFGVHRFSLSVIRHSIFQFFKPDQMECVFSKHWVSLFYRMWLWTAIRVRWVDIKIYINQQFGNYHQHIRASVFPWPFHSSLHGEWWIPLSNHRSLLLRLYSATSHNLFLYNASHRWRTYARGSVCRVGISSPNEDLDGS